MDDIDCAVPLSAIHVQWSDPEDAYIARTEQFPGLSNADHWSSLAAINGLLDKIHERAGDTRVQHRASHP